MANITKLNFIKQVKAQYVSASEDSGTITYGNLGSKIHKAIDNTDVSPLTGKKSANQIISNLVSNYRDATSDTSTITYGQFPQKVYDAIKAGPTPPGPTPTDSYHEYVDEQGNPDPIVIYDGTVIFEDMEGMVGVVITGANVSAFRPSVRLSLKIDGTEYYIDGTTPDYELPLYYMDSSTHLFGNVEWYFALVGQTFTYETSSNVPVVALFDDEIIQMVSIMDEQTGEPLIPLGEHTLSIKALGDCTGNNIIIERGNYGANEEYHSDYVFAQDYFKNPVDITSPYFNENALINLPTLEYYNYSDIDEPTTYDIFRTVYDSSSGDFSYIASGSTVAGTPVTDNMRILIGPFELKESASNVNSAVLYPNKLQPQYIALSIAGGDKSIIGRSIYSDFIPFNFYDYYDSGDFDFNGIEVSVKYYDESNVLHEASAHTSLDNAVEFQGEIGGNTYHYISLGYDDQLAFILQPYAPVTGSSAPVFETDKYYSYNAGVNVYNLLTEEPADWSTNWTDYFVVSTRQTRESNYATVLNASHAQMTALKIPGGNLCVEMGLDNPSKPGLALMLVYDEPLATTENLTKPQMQFSVNFVKISN